MCDFLVNLDDFFAVVCTSFHEVVVCTRYVPHFNSQPSSLFPHLVCQQQNPCMLMFPEHPIVGGATTLIDAISISLIPSESIYPILEHACSSNCTLTQQEAAAAAAAA